MDIFHQGVPRVFVSDLPNPEKKPGFCKAVVELTQGMNERQSLSSIKSLWDRQHPAKLSCWVMVLAGLVEGKLRPGGSAAKMLRVQCLQAELAAWGDELLLLGQENLHSFCLA